MLNFDNFSKLSITKKATQIASPFFSYLPKPDHSVVFKIDYELQVSVANYELKITKQKI